MRYPHPEKDQMRCSRHVNRANEMLTHANGTNEMFFTGDDNKCSLKAAQLFPRCTSTRRGLGGAQSKAFDL